ncbi:PhoB family transcriptional regulator [Aurantiacibacter atlanticus]|uniref:PhoB family transcriptional regulator n=1 Tax=Aurantiacibacter atlanticus TaxID=1648404 RepID=A0A0H4VDT3_9SPHN|nr:response regulator transcription factor [Aurantiacibacter atlanticus]AKQ42847.1 PhoB family transcriptional regulator [Aurantiacibacter atlanticus]MDF1834881.1 response regulator transcription factor [Alteraurantiacibacter sp. bin_em_oilr2.035]
MQRVSIFTSNRDAARFEPFIHDDTTFTFNYLTPEGPARLVDGEAWAFVDWVMDTLSGLEMVRRLRADPRMAHAHITMVLEEDDVEDRRRALKVGADDYAITPLDRQAMLDRVLAVHSDHRNAAAYRLIELGDFVINTNSEQARWKGQRIALRPNEFRVLRFLAENPNRIFSREELITALGKAGDPDYLRTVDVWIKRLRMGLRTVGAAHLLRTVHGKGYVFDEL